DRKFQPTRILVENGLPIRRQAQPRIVCFRIPPRSKFMVRYDEIRRAANQFLWQCPARVEVFRTPRSEIRPEFPASESGGRYFFYFQYFAKNLRWEIRKAGKYRRHFRRKHHAFFQ